MRVNSTENAAKRKEKRARRVFLANDETVTLDRQLFWRDLAQKGMADQKKGMERFEPFSFFAMLCYQLKKKFQKAQMAP